MAKYGKSKKSGKRSVRRVKPASKTKRTKFVGGYQA